MSAPVHRSPRTPALVIAVLVAGVACGHPGRTTTATPPTSAGPGRAARPFGRAGVPIAPSPDRSVPQGIGTDGPIEVITTPAVVTITIPDVLFEFGDASLKPEADDALLKLLDLLTRDYSKSSAEIVGYTDSVGDDDYNQALSERRGRAVAEWLVRHTVDLHRLTVSGRGEADPVADNSTPEGRRLNRRVVVLIARP